MIVGGLLGVPAGSEISFHDAIFRLPTGVSFLICRLRRVSRLDFGFLSAEI